MATVEQLITEVRVEADTQGIKAVDQAMNALARTEQGLAQANDNLANTSERVTRSTASLETAHSRLKSTFDAAYRAETLYQQQLEKLEAQHRALGVSTAEANRQIDLLAAKYSTAASAAERLEAAARNAARANMQMSGLTSSQAAAQGRALSPMNMGALGAYSAMPNAARDMAALAGSTRAAAYEVKNLQFQLYDVATMAAMGASPFMILASQSAQFAQILGGAGGVKASLALVGTALSGLMPIVAALALPATVAGLVMMLNRTQEATEATKAFQTAMEGLDRILPTAGQSARKQAEELKNLTMAYRETANAALEAALAEAQAIESRLAAASNMGVGNGGAFGESGILGDIAAEQDRQRLEAAQGEVAKIRKQIEDFNKRVSEGRQEQERAAVGTDTFRTSLESLRGTIKGTTADLNALDPLAIAQKFLEAKAALDAGLAAGSISPQDYGVALGGLGRQRDEAMRRYRMGPQAPIPVPKGNPARDENVDLSTVPGTGAEMDAKAKAFIENARQQSSSLQMQIDTFGMAEGAAARYRKEQELLNQAMQQGVQVTPELKAQIENIAQQHSDATVKLKEMQDAQQAAQDAQQFLGQTLEQTLMGIAQGGDAAKQAILGLVAALLRAALLGEGPLRGLFAKGGIFDKLAGAAAGGGGSAASAVGAMATRAASGIGSDARFPIAAGNDNAVMSAPVGAVERGALAPLYGQPPIPGLKQAPQFGMPPIPGLQRTSSVDPSDFTRVVSAGRGYTTVQAADGSIFKMVGARNWRNNNPGNIEYGRFAQSQGAVGSDGRFAVFPDYDAGRAAKEALLFESPAYRNRTIEGAINRYAPPFENNTSAYANQVAQATGVPLNTPLSALSADQRTAMLDAMQRVEGFRPGQAIQLSGPNVATASLENVAPKLQAIVPPLQSMKPALDAMKTATQGAGTALQQIPQMLQGLGGGGGGLGGLLSGLGGFLGGGGGSIGGLYASGGYVSGPGTSTSDSIRARLSNGEFVMNAEATRKNRPALEAMNSGRQAKSRPRDVYLGGHTVSMVFHGKQDESVVEMIDARLAAALEQDNRRRQEMAEYDRQNEWRRG